MKLILEVFGSLCSIEEFKINDIDADYCEFGEKYDRNPESAQDYGCGDMHFTRKEFTQEILDKYSITGEEYEKICDQLEEKLSFGNCEWCV